MISFLNLPQNAQNPSQAQLTPRSRQALNRIGYNIDDLFPKSSQEIIRKYGDRVQDKALIEIRVQHYETRRLQKIDSLLVQRQNILQEEADGNWSPRGRSRVAESDSSSNQKSTMIEKELKQLERIKQKQQKEIEQTIYYEMKMEEIRKGNEGKMTIHKEKYEKRRKELERKRKLEEQQKKQKEEVARLRKVEELEAQERVFQELKLKEEVIRENDRRKQLEREQHSRIVREEKKLKQEEFFRHKERNLMEQQGQMEIKKVEIERKQEQRLKAMALVNEKRKEESECKRQEKQQKLRLARIRNEDQMNELSDKYKIREQEQEVRRLQFQQQKKQHAEEMKIRSEMHDAKLKQVLEQNARLEEERKEDFYAKQKQAEIRKQELEAQHNLDIIEKKKLQEAREEERRRICENNQRRMEENKSEMVHKLEAKELNLVRVQREREEKIKFKHNDDLLKRADKKENVERILKVQEYDNRKLMQRIDQKMEKADRIKLQREDLLEQRQLMKKEIDRQKRDMFEKIEKLKLGKLDPNELLQSLSMDSGPAVKVEKSHQAQPEKESKPKPLRKNYYILNPIKERCTIENKQIDPKAAVKLESRTRTAQSKKPPHNLQRISACKAQKTDEELKRELELLTEKHNIEMLRLLEEEQSAQNQREVKLMKLTLEERRLFQKDYGIERAKAQTRIQKLSDNQNVDLNRFKKNHNLRC